MGVMKFLLPRRDLLAPDAVDRAYMAGLDEIPWRVRVRWTDDGLVVERDENDSGNFFIPCPVEGRGELMLSTASLMERSQPYDLLVELARGTLNRLRNQVAGWELHGMAIPQHVRSLVSAALEQLSVAVTERDNPQQASQRAEQATGSALTAIDALTGVYVEQSLAARRPQGAKLPTLLGINLGSTRPSDALAAALAPAFNTAIVPLVWREIEAQEGKRDWTATDAQIEWCRATGLRVCGGPLLQIDRWSLPDWMYLWGADDADSFRSCVADHIQAVVERYRGKVQLWQCAARLNTNNDFDQGEEDRLRLAVIALESVRRADPRAPVVISIDQPWGAYMSRNDYDLSPLHFADSLVRAEMGLAGIGLDIDFGYTPHGTEPRDVLELGRQIERFSSLGLPLLVSVTAPSDNTPDKHARLKTRVIDYATAGKPTPATQRAWAERYLPLLLAKQPVQGIIWNQLQDSHPHAFPHGGLYDTANKPKPIVEYLQKFRREYVA